MQPRTTETNRLLDIYVDHRLVDTVPVLKTQNETEFKSQILRERASEGLIYIKVRKLKDAVEIVSPECPGGVCPVRTTPAQKAAQTALNATKPQAAQQPLAAPLPDLKTQGMAVAAGVENNPSLEVKRPSAMVTTPEGIGIQVSMPHEQNTLDKQS